MWGGMLSRCERESDPFFHCYGGRGISVCAQWHDPRVFVAEVEGSIGKRPPGMTLDRIDNDGNYEPGNVQWATPLQQAQHRRHVPPRDPHAVGLRAWQARPLRVAVCASCGIEFETHAPAQEREFCRRSHALRYRRAHGLDDVEKTCHWCGNRFTSNKHDDTRHCSSSCAAFCQHADDPCPMKEVVPGVVANTDRQ